MLLDDSAFFGIFSLHALCSVRGGSRRPAGFTDAELKTWSPNGAFLWKTMPTLKCHIKPYFIVHRHVPLKGTVAKNRVWFPKPEASKSSPPLALRDLQAPEGGVKGKGLEEFLQGEYDSVPVQQTPGLKRSLYSSCSQARVQFFLPETPHVLVDPAAGLWLDTQHAEALLGEDELLIERK
ncbi:hypothetical protein SRHO_G00227030 [Serrasalmus rhombeus]